MSGIEDRITAFRDGPARVDDDDVAYDRSIFSRWQKHGKDRLYVRDPGDGYLSLDGDGGKTLRHPEGPMTQFGGHKDRVRSLDDGTTIHYATDGSHDWIVAVIPDER
ncbi:hypothetical protein [Halocatena halophila]|uniref:hypothetical protein n=1 Tax=Halocatena halophila TaxID=2814576 RepID=UPI002ED60BAE